MSGIKKIKKIQFEVDGRRYEAANNTLLTDSIGGDDWGFLRERSDQDWSQELWGHNLVGRDHEGEISHFRRGRSHWYSRQGLVDSVLYGTNLVVRRVQ